MGKIIYNGLVSKIKENFSKKIKKKNDGVSGIKSSIINNLEYFNDCCVCDIMVPRKDMKAVSLNDGKDALVTSFSSDHFSRLPVYQDDLDNIIGFIHIKDLISQIANKDIKAKNIMKKIMFVPRQMKAMDLFIKMQKNKLHIAIVLDDFGGTDGLITIMDIVEEIVGKIDDEHNFISDATLIPIGINKYEANAMINLRIVDKMLGTKLDGQFDCETLCGYITAFYGSIPAINTEIKFDEQITFIIKNVDDRKINKVIIMLNDNINNDDE